MHTMSLPMVYEAIAISGMPQEVIDRIWEEEKPTKPTVKWSRKVTRQV